MSIVLCKWIFFNSRDIIWCCRTFHSNGLEITLRKLIKPQKQTQKRTLTIKLTTKAIISCHTWYTCQFELWYEKLWLWFSRRRVTHCACMGGLAWLGFFSRPVPLLKTRIEIFIFFAFRLIFSEQHAVTVTFMIVCYTLDCVCVNWSKLKRLIKVNTFG